MDLYMFQQLLLQFGKPSHVLCEVVAKFVDWLANSHPSWAAYHALMAGRLVALDKCPGVHPLGIGKTWRRICVKLITSACGSAAKEQCGINQLCAGLKAGIDGSIHAPSQNAGPSAKRRKDGFFFSLTPLTCSTRLTKLACSGPFDMNGHPLHNFHLTDIVTGQPSWSGAKAAPQLPSFLEMVSLKVPP
jgi:hypothetical protein